MSVISFTHTCSLHFFGFLVLTQYLGISTVLVVVILVIIQFRLRGIRTCSVKMSAKAKPFCVFCLKKNEPLLPFISSYIEKCKNILEIRQKHNLCMKDAKVPVEVSELQKYHSKCYRQFTALSKRYRSSSLAEKSSHESR